MTPALVAIALIASKLVFQLSQSAEESVIE
jgi:hypothetical protein